MPVVPPRREIPRLRPAHRAPKPALAIRSAQTRRWTAELLREDVSCLVLYGMDGIGKSTLARQIAVRVRRVRPVSVLDNPGDIESALAAPGKLLITCRAPFVTSNPRVAFRRVGPLTRSGAVELSSSLPNLRTLPESSHERIWRLVAGHPGAIKLLDERLLTEPYPSVDARLSAAVSAITGWPADRIQPTELPAHVAQTIATISLDLLRGRVMGELTVRTRRRSALRRKRDLALAAAVALALTAGGVAAFGASAAAPRPVAGNPTAPRPAGAHPAGLRPAGARPAGLRAAGRAVPSRPVVPEPSAGDRAQATAWIAGQLAPGTKVACDPAMCSALPHMVTEVPVTDTEAAVLIATPRVRANLGGRVAVLAPVVLASYGTGASRIDIRLVAAAGYDSRLNSDRAERRRAGESLLGNPDLSLSAAARSQLAAGQVDSRILLTLAALLQEQPVTVAEFSDGGPGDVPFRAAQLEGAAGPMAVFFGRQSEPFRPSVFTASQGKLFVQFSAPFPLGLLGQP